MVPKAVFALDKQNVLHILYNHTIQTHKIVLITAIQIEMLLTVTFPKSSPHTIPAGSVEPRVLILRK